MFDPEYFEAARQKFGKYYPLFIAAPFVGGVVLAATIVIFT